MTNSPKVVTGVIETIPIAQTATSILGKDTSQDVIQAGSELFIKGVVSTAKDIRERLLRIFGNAKDVDFYLNYEDELIHDLVKAVQDITSKYPLAVLIDSYEELLHLDPQLRDQFLIKLPEQVALVMAGRNSIYNDCDHGWRKDTHFFEMQKFTSAESKSFLRKYGGIRNSELADTIYHFTQGVPQAVALAADSSLRVPRRADAIQLFQGETQAGSSEHGRVWVIHEMTKRFLNLVKEDERAVIDACAILWRISKDGLEYLLGHSLPKDFIDRPERFSFLRKHGSQLVFHDTVRTYLLQDLRDNQPDYFRDLHQRAAEFAKHKHEDLQIAADKQLDDEKFRAWTLEYIYHLLQIDLQQGIAVLYDMFAEALWQQDFEYCLDLVNLTKEPLATIVPGIELLQSGCSLCLVKDYLKAEFAFRRLSDLDIPSPRFHQMVHDTLGDLYDLDKLNRPQEAVQHYEVALAYFRQFGEITRVSTTLLNLARCQREIGEFEVAIESIKESIQLRESLNDKDQLVYAVRQLGIIFRQRGKYEDAVREFERARIICEEQNRLSDMAEMWNAIGITYRAWDKHEQALAAYTKSLKSFETLNRHANMADVMLGIGLTYLGWGNHYEEAVDALTKSRKVYEELDQSESIVELWYWLGITYHTWGRYEQAIEAYAEAFRQFEALGRRIDMAGVMLRVGRTYLAWDKHAEAIAALMKSQEISGAIDRPKDVAELWDAIGTAYREWGKREWGKYEQALEAYTKASKQFEALDKPENIAGVQYRIGLVYSAWGKYADSVKELEKARIMCERLNRLSDVAEVWNTIGTVYHEWGKYELALEAYTKASKQFEALDKPENIAGVQYRIGLVYSAWGKYADSVKELEKARIMCEGLNRLSDVAEVWNTIGSVYREWGKYERALEAYTKASKQFEALGDKHADLADVTFGIGLTYNSWGNQNEAVDALTKSRTMYEERDQRENVADLWNWLGIVYAGWGKYEQALDAFSKALSLLETLGKRSRIVSVQYHIGLVYSAWGNYSDATKELEKARTICEEERRPRDLALMWHGLGLAYYQWGRYEQALKYYQEALQRFESLENEQHVADVRYWIGRTYYEMQESDMALKSFGQSEQVSRRIGDDNNTIYALIRSGTALAKLERHVEASSVLREAIMIAKELDLDEQLADCYAGLVVIQREAQQLENARQAFLDALRLYEASGSRLDVAQVSQEMALAEADLGDHVRALELLENAVAIYRQYRRKMRLAKALKELGKLQKIFGLESFHAALSEAQELFAEMDCPDEKDAVGFMLMM